MHKFSALMFFVVLASAVSLVTAICCGRGKHGYCNDCSKVGARAYHAKFCCYNGTSHRDSCNIFCCNCKKCLTGQPIITHFSGWVFGKKYKCKSHDVEAADYQDDLADTRDRFDELDGDADGVINKNEFLAALRTHLGGANGDIAASHLLRSDDPLVAADFVDAVNADDLSEDENDDFVQMATREFQDMDRNDDGAIQANEFDRNLEDFYY